MTQPSAVRLDVQRPVATITLSRPAALNALTREMLVDLGEAIEGVSQDPGVSVLVLTGEGRAFSAGVDLKALGQRPLPGGSVGDYLDGPARVVTGLLAGIPQVVIAKVNGFCFTGALELVLACDLVVAAEEAKFADTHTKWGLRPSWGMSQRLARMVGVSRARYLSYTARTFTGVEAAAWGLAALAVPRAELDATVEELAQEIATNSASAAAAYKNLYAAALDLGLAEGLDFEATTRFPITDTEERVASFR